MALALVRGGRRGLTLICLILAVVFCSIPQRVRCATGQVEYRVEEEVEEDILGTISPGGDARELVFNQGEGAQPQGDQVLGFKFRLDSNLPPGTILTRARIFFTAAETATDTTPQLRFFLLATDDGVDLTPRSTTPALLGSGAHVGASSFWEPGPWTQGNDFRTNTVHFLLQRVLDRPGFQTGNSVVFVLKRNQDDISSQTRTAVAGSARLVVDFEIPSTPSPSLAPTKSTPSPTFSPTSSTDSPTPQITSAPSTSQPTTSQPTTSQPTSKPTSQPTSQPTSGPTSASTPIKTGDSDGAEDSSGDEDNGDTGSPESDKEEETSTFIFAAIALVAIALSLAFALAVISRRQQQVPQNQHFMPSAGPGPDYFSQGRSNSDHWHHQNREYQLRTVTPMQSTEPVPFGYKFHPNMKLPQTGYSGQGQQITASSQVLHRHDINSLPQNQGRSQSEYHGNRPPRNSPYLNYDDAQRKSRFATDNSRTPTMWQKYL